MADLVSQASQRTAIQRAILKIVRISIEGQGEKKKSKDLYQIIKANQPINKLLRVTVADLDHSIEGRVLREKKITGNRA